MNFTTAPGKSTIKYLGLCPTLLLILSCAVPRQMNLLPAPTIPTSGYRAKEVITRWTRADICTSRFQTTLEASVLYISWNVRASLIRELFKARAANQSELQDLIVKEAFLDEQWHEFVIAANSSVAEWSDLTKDAGLWKIYLVNSQGESLEAVSIEEWRPSSAEAWKYYEFINPWSRTYKLRFAKNQSDGNPFLAGTNEFSLNLRSYLGSLTFQWRLAVDSRQNPQ